MTADKPSWQCATPGCRRAKYRGETCGTCAKLAGGPRAIKVTRSTVYPTGETRYSEAQHQIEMTDGRQTWWVGAREEAAA